MWKERLERLEKNRAAQKEPGGEKRVQRQHMRGKMTARERVLRLLDNNSFHELNACRKTDASASPLGARGIYPGDGVITGWGKINGRTVCIAADDFTVIGGTMGTIHAKKILAIQDLALKKKVPVIFLNDSGGARIEEGINALTGYGEMFRRHVHSSGKIPQICAIMGPCSGGASYSPALCDFVFCVKGTSNMFITGPDVVASVLGKRPDMEDLGGAWMHATKSGVAHAVFDDEESCLDGIRTLLEFLPQNCDEFPRELRADTGASQEPLSGSSFAAEPEDLADRIGSRSASRESFMKIVPDNPRQAYDMHKLIEAICDYLPFFEIQKHFAPNAITGFTYLDGRVTGIVANQPLAMGGSLDVDASDKIARFIRFCDCFNIQLLTLVDVPAFLPGTDQEQKGIIRHGAKILYAYSEASVPKVTLIVRKAYGGAYIAMNSKSLGADIVYAWPVAEIAVMGAEGAVHILHRKDLAESPNPIADTKRWKDEYEETFANPDIAENQGFVDDVIFPEETRERLISAFALLGENVHAKYSHGNIPL